MKFEVFKIYNSETGKFSRGGVGPSWSTKGKSWSGLGPLKLHLRQFCSNSGYSYKDGSIQSSCSKIVDGEREWGHYLGRDKYWFNNIPKSWIVQKYIPEGMTEFSARELYPESTHELDSLY